MQTDVAVSGTHITGNLNYVTGYTGYSSNAQEQFGNFLALHMETSLENGRTQSRIYGSSVWKSPDANGNIVHRIADKNIGIEVRVFNDENSYGAMQFYSLSDMVIQGPPEIPEPDVALAGADILGHKVSYYSENLAYDDGTYTGTLKYITKFTQFSNIISEQQGNYLPVAVHGAENTSYSMSTGSGATPKKVDNTHFVVRIMSKDQANLVVNSKSGESSSFKRLDISALVLEEKPKIQVSILTLTREGDDPLTVGKTRQLTATVEPADATNKTVTFKTSNNTVADVNISGQVTGIAPGTATITATSADDPTKTATVEITVVPAPVAVTGVTLDKTTATVEQGKTVALQATVAPANATDKSVTWSSRDTAIATVSDKGIITGVKIGTTNIICASQSDSTKSATCAVTVTAPTVAVTGVTLDKTTATVEQGKTVALQATVAPANATDKSVTWSSDNTAVATVSNAGLVTAVSDGTANITVTTTNGKKTAKCAITVTPTPQFDSESGRYTDASIKKFLDSKRTGKKYGIQYSKSNAIATTKTLDNVDIENPVPGTDTVAAVDPYKAEGGPFYFMEVNGGVNEDGTPYVTAISGDDHGFSRSNPNESTWILHPVLYYKMTETDDSIEFSITDMPAEGYIREGDASITDTIARSYILRAKYALSKTADGKFVSTSGAKPFIRTCSYQQGISDLSSKSGYSYLNSWDLWYRQIMHLIKYGGAKGKNAQSFMAGATSYNVQVVPAVAEENVKRVIVSNDAAANIIVGSNMSLGPAVAVGATDRNQRVTYDKFDMAKVTKIDTYDDNNKAIYFEDNASTFSTTTTDLLSTMPYSTGFCDSVDGDGSPLNNTNGKTPYVIQGIECADGFNEILGDVQVKYNGTDAPEVYRVFDTSKAATTITDDYVATGLAYAAKASAQSIWGTYPGFSKGLMIGLGDQGSSTTGTCDGPWIDKISLNGNCILATGGNLNDGTNAGPWYASASGGVSGSSWSDGSRLSAVGKSHA